MKNILKVSLLLLLAFNCANLTSYSQSPLNADEAKVTSHNRENDPEYKLGRIKWLDMMHFTAPGTCWQAIESETKRSKQALRQEKLNNALLQGKKYPDLLQAEQFANGKITAHWQERGSNNQAGRVHTADIDFDNKLIYLASAGGNIWKGNLNGGDWECLNNAMQIKDIRTVKLLKYQGNNRIIAVGNNPAAVHYSDDEGLSWNTAEGLDQAENWGWMKRSVVTGDDEMKIYTICSEWNTETWRQQSAVYMSTDKGENFESIATFETNINFIDIWAAPRSNEVYLQIKDTLFQIENAEFTKIEQNEDIRGLDGSYSQVMLTGTKGIDGIRLALALSSQIERASYIFYAESVESGYLYIGDVPERPFTANSFAISLYTDGTMFFGGVNCWKTTNRGITWKEVNDWAEYYQHPMTKLHADICGINVFADNEGKEHILICTDGGIYESKDGLFSVKNISNTGLNISQYYSTYTENGGDYSLFAGSQDQGFQYNEKPNSDVYDLIQYYSGDYGHLSSGNDGKTIWSVYPGTVYLYNKAGSTFSIHASGCKGSSGNRVWLPPIKVHPSDPYRAYMASSSESGSKLWKLDFNNGKSIETEENHFNFKDANTGAIASSIEISTLDPENVYVMTSNGDFFGSTDDGENWTKTSRDSMPHNHYLYGNCIQHSRKTPGLIYIAGSGYSNPAAFVSKDNGESFTSIGNGLPPTLIYDIDLSDNENFLFAATEAGPYVYSVLAGKWFDIGGFGAPDQTYWSVEYIPSLNTARFATYGRGIWDFVVDSYASAPEAETSSKVNPELTAQPNPFGEQTRIMLNLAESGNVSVRIFDITGRIVARLHEGYLAEGIHTFDWDGTAFGAMALPAGAYTCIAAVNGSVAHVVLINN